MHMGAGGGGGGEGEWWKGLGFKISQSTRFTQKYFYFSPLANRVTSKPSAKTR